MADSGGGGPTADRGGSGPTADRGGSGPMTGAHGAGDAQPIADGERLPPAFYGRRGGWRADWWTLLHPPYTLWHVSYAVIGAGLAPHLDWLALAATAIAFFLAVGIAAHALDEFHGRPLGTAISDRTLWTVATIALAGAVGLGIVAVSRSGPALIPFIVVGVGLVLGYNLELFGGRLHNDVSFAAGWGGFPVAVGYVAQAPPLTSAGVAAVVLATLAAAAFSHAQRCLSTPARTVRRRTRHLSGVVTFSDGSQGTLDRARVLEPLEGALRAMSWAVPLLAAAIIFARLPA